MRLKIVLSSVAVIAIATAPTFAAESPISLSPKGGQSQGQAQSNPKQGPQVERLPNQRPPSALNAEQHAGSYRFPATRQELEQAANECAKQVQALWSERNDLERYRLPMFQKNIGEAQQRCRKLRELAETIKLADEQLYTYQQSLGQAERCFSAG